MEAGGKDCEEETLQTAFKKLRVDAESLTGAVSVSEALTPRTASRVCVDGNGVKSKLSCPKDNWHCCTRKTSRGASRSQRRRRSKSPILHPPKFTYCSSTTTSALPPPAGCLKHRHLAVPEAPEPAADELTGSSLNPPATTELCSSGTPGNISPLLFGSSAGYDAQISGVVSSPSLPEIVTATSSRQDGSNSGDVQSSEGVSSIKSACEGAESGAAEAADFRALSELHSHVSSSCSCSQRGPSDSQEESEQEPKPSCSCGSHPQGWNGMEVYSFTGLRSVISECERSLPSHEDTSRTLSSNAAAASSPSSSSAALSSGSPRSCSEQARAYVDDITIEDLSGYMEYYLYIPKKMSHMAEMMYT